MQIFPGTSPSDVSGVFALLSFLSDPKANATRLQELKKQADDAQAKLDQQEKDRQDLVAKQASLAETATTIQSNQEELDSMKADLVARVQQHMKDKQDFEDYRASVSADISSAAKDIANRDAAVSKREAAIQNNNAAVQSEYAKATALRKQYEDRISQLKAAIA